jgi:hypothetical protein
MPVNTREHPPDPAFAAVGAAALAVEGPPLEQLRARSRTNFWTSILLMSAALVAPPPTFMFIGASSVGCRGSIAATLARFRAGHDRLMRKGAQV